MSTFKTRRAYQFTITDSSISFPTYSAVHRNFTTVDSHLFISVSFGTPM